MGFDLLLEGSIALALLIRVVISFSGSERSVVRADFSNRPRADLPLPSYRFGDQQRRNPKAVSRAHQ